HLGLPDIQRAAGASELFDTQVVFENYPILVEAAASQPASDLRVTAAEGHDASHYPLTLVAIPGERLHLRLDYDARAFDRQSVDKVAAGLLRLLDIAIADPEAPLYRVSIVDGEERRALVEDFNATAHEVRRATLPALFEEQVSRTPDAVALV